jgi:hypothetical protein
MPTNLVPGKKRRGMERIKKEKGDQIPTFAFLHMELHSLPVTFFYIPSHPYM